jgi:hydrogenase maturation protein HypF
MLPYTPLHHLLLERALTALVMTSGNRTGEPPCIDNAAAFSVLSGIADYFLVHDRPIYQRNDDSLVQVSDGGLHFIRRARGYVPMPIELAHPLPPTLACGAELKSTVCLARDKTAIVSQHIGDLSAAPTLDFFEETIAHLKKVTGIPPQLVAHDLHPDYLSTRYAQGLPGVQRIGVQHHHAHVVSCMAEHGLDGPVIGLALDGTGFGPDGTVWGGEALITERACFTRAARLACVPMPGGEAAIREPWRMAVSYLHHGFGEDFLSLEPLPLFRGMDRRQCRPVLEMIGKGLNAPLTSSAGRLFDGVSAICGLIRRISFEGQAAMALEALAGNAPGEEGPSYAWDVHREEDLREIQIAPLIRQLAADLMAGLPAKEVSRKFHHTLVRMWGDLCTDIRRETGLDRVVMSGGVFQNRCLSAGLAAYLTRLGFRVFTHGKVPANDGGLSLGQAVVAGALFHKSVKEL